MSVVLVISSVLNISIMYIVTSTSFLIRQLLDYMISDISGFIFRFSVAVFLSLILGVVPFFNIIFSLIDDLIDLAKDFLKKKIKVLEYHVVKKKHIGLKQVGLV